MQRSATLTACALAALAAAGAAGASRAVIPAGESKALRASVTTTSVPYRYGYGVGVDYRALRGWTVTLPGDVTLPRYWLG